MDNITDIIQNLSEELKEEKEAYLRKKNELDKLIMRIDKMQNALKSLSELESINEGESSIHNVSVGDKSNLVPHKTMIRTLNHLPNIKPWDKLQFDDAIVSILKENDIPMTTKELMEVYNSRVTKQKSRSSFSGMISQRLKKTKKYASFDLSKMEGRVKMVLGLPHWFDENHKLKEDYLNKLFEETTLFD